MIMISSDKKTNNKNLKTKKNSKGTNDLTFKLSPKCHHGVAVKLIFITLVNLLSLEQSHQKCMGI